MNPKIIEDLLHEQPTQAQHYRVVLIEALYALKSLDSYLLSENLERSSLARFCIRKILKELEVNNETKND